MGSQGVGHDWATKQWPQREQAADDEPWAQTCDWAGLLELVSYTLAPSLISVLSERRVSESKPTVSPRLEPNDLQINLLLLEFSLSSIGTGHLYWSQRRRWGAQIPGANRHKHTAAVQTVLRAVGQAPGEGRFRWKDLSCPSHLLQQDGQLWPEGVPRLSFRKLDIWGKLIHPTNMRGLYQLWAGPPCPSPGLPQTRTRDRTFSLLRASQTDSHSFLWELLVGSVCQSFSCVDFLWPHGLGPHQAPLSMGFSRQDCWCGLPSPSPGTPTQGSNPGLPHCRETLYLLSHQGRF